MADHPRAQPEILFVRCEAGLTAELERAANDDGRNLSDWVRRTLRVAAGLPATSISTAKTGRSTNNRRTGIDRGKRRA